MLISVDQIREILGWEQNSRIESWNSARMTGRRGEVSGLLSTADLNKTSDKARFVETEGRCSGLGKVRVEPWNSMSYLHKISGVPGQKTLGNPRVGVGKTV